MSNWHGILKIMEINHVRNDEVIWKAENLRNMLHTTGEQFILQCAFFTGQQGVPPTDYYFGLDGRATLEYIDELTTAQGAEPSTINSGYNRQSVGASGGFTVDKFGTNPEIYRATTKVITFTATNTYSVTVKNLFMTNVQINQTGVLIASVPLTQSLTLVSGDAINVKMSVQLHDV